MTITPGVLARQACALPLACSPGELAHQHGSARMPHGPERQLFGQALVRALLDASDALGFGAVLLSSSAKMLHANEEARRHIGEHITFVQGRLVLQNRGAAETLRQLLRAMQDDPSEAIRREHLLRLPRDGQRPVVVRLLPIPSPLSDLLDGAAVLMVLLDSDEHPCPTVAALQETFGLTRGEALVSLQLMRGDSPREISAARKVSIGTVRAQLKALFAKTQTSRQSELVWLLARLATLAPSSSETVRLPTDEGCSGGA